MNRILVSIGSNIDRRKHIASGVEALREAFGEVALSPIYETPAEGFEGDDFFNLVAGFDSDLSPEALNQRFKAIEAAHGRERLDEKFAPRTLDIDLLLYGDEIIDAGGVQTPRDEILRYAFVLQPLADLVPDGVYPGREETFAALWRAELDSGRMKPGRRVSIDLGT
ncbi:MAG TPA: 2-amino-4-hydroxy-6-hydroxymethyldihydropteridine diphosphokinase [Gammaproteobacteria bacterium]|nr:2-amino-4-hydroxy-6-hydroxymethyldihydropteridine diphosphokinase [Gammaproteobacteria bacterium]